MRAPRAVAPLLATVLLVGVPAACGGSSDSALGRYLQADARPADPSARVQFGRGSLPADFPSGLPRLPRAQLLGWQRTQSDTAIAWEAVFEAPGDTSSALDAVRNGLKAGGWQVTDTSTRRGFQALNVGGSGANNGRTGVLSVGPAVRQGWVQYLAEIGSDR